jgi:hypothetical protein
MAGPKLYGDNREEDEGRQDFFFVKKKQKTFFNWGTGSFKVNDQKEKEFFASFFAKKEDLA